MHSIILLTSIKTNQYTYLYIGGVAFDAALVYGGDVNLQRGL